MALIPAMIGQVFYPRMTEEYSARGISRSLIKFATQASLVSATISGLICGASYLTLPWVVERFDPAYIGGLPALRVALAAYFLISLSAGPNYFLISTVQKRRQLVVLLGAAAIMFVSGYCLAGRGLVGIAWSLAIATGAYVTGVWLIVFASVAARRRRA
jgi:O-antigen/teichoic acid export membrane protein